jgi:decaprenyl-phosphate phosphoribosyltransferase
MITVWLKALRSYQWIKNLIVFTALIFSGQLLDLNAFITTTYVFVIFCILSSTSYLFNDIIDYEQDRKHPKKKFRPIASGAVSIQQATFVGFILAIIALLLSLTISIPLFLLAISFLSLHIIYSLKLKQLVLIDIFVISLSFVMRAFAGAEFSNLNLHIPIWLILTIFFVSLFIATVKRRAELAFTSGEARKTLQMYSKEVLDLMMAMFGTASIFCYCAYTYFEPSPQFNSAMSEYIKEIFPDYVARKWFTLTIPLVVYGIVRYVHLFFRDNKGEEPENMLTHDKGLLLSIFLWGISIISLIYLLG